MGSFFLAEGLVVSRFGKTLEFSARAGDELYFEEPETGCRVTLNESQFWSELHTQRISIANAFSSPKVLLPPPSPGPTENLDLGSLPQKIQDDVVRKLTYLSKLRALGITRGQTHAISREAKRIAENIEDPRGAPGTSTIQRWWQCYEQQGFESNALVSQNVMRRRNNRIDTESNAFVEQQIDDKFAINTRPSMAGAYRDYENALRQQNSMRKEKALPPLYKIAPRTFYARIYARSKKELMISREGYEAARRHFHMIRGHLPSEHALDVVEIDHTPMNLFVIDDLAFLPLGRPWLTAIKDRYSGVLLGFYVSFQATGLESIFGAIKHSLSSHHQAYELWPDLQNPWPAFGRGHYYASDRGADFLSPRYRSAIVSLGAMYEHCERRTPWLKGGIERFFLTLEQTFFEVLPGRTFSSLAVRGDYEPEKDAVVRFSTLVHLLHIWAADFHNVLPNTRKLARPLDLWNESIGIAPPPYPASVDQLNIMLGEHHSGKLCQEGIRHHWLNYADDQLSELMDAIGPGTSVQFVAPREDLGAIYVLDPRTQRHICVPSTRPEYASGLSAFQHALLRKQAGIRLTKGRAIDTLLEARARVQERLRDDLESKKIATNVRLARIAGINSNAVLTGTPKSITTALPGKQEFEDTPAPPKATPSPFTNVPRYSWGA
ncbi:transposase [Pandoraea sputorum]|uniref:transposase n=1 Tax=Pandoraea sputorum TaxID=93222 RepID=UPI002B2DED50|nr:hypothetical protein THI4931_22300 [Pandoraea sputorum]